MSQPNPPGDIPLFEGLGAEWNDIVGAIPEDRRGELAPKLKERLDAFTPLKQWEDFQKSGVTPDQAGTALQLFNIIENNPREVYDQIGKHLGLTKEETKEVVKEIKAAEASGDDSRIQALQQQVETLAQIAIAQRNMSSQEKQEAEADAQLDKELTDLRGKYGNSFPEDEIVMRMVHKNLTAEQAYQEYAQRSSDLIKRRPAPFVMGNGGAVPNKSIDVKKLDNAGTKNLVAQMMQNAQNEANN